MSPRSVRHLADGENREWEVEDLETVKCRKPHIRMLHKTLTLCRIVWFRSQFTEFYFGCLHKCHSLLSHKLSLFEASIFGVAYYSDRNITLFPFQTNYQDNWGLSEALPLNKTCSLQVSYPIAVRRCFGDNHSLTMRPGTKRPAEKFHPEPAVASVKHLFSSPISWRGGDITVSISGRK